MHRTVAKALNIDNCLNYLMVLLKAVRELDSADFDSRLEFVIVLFKLKLYKKAIKEAK
jgi:hypothetical protein